MREVAISVAKAILHSIVGGSKVPESKDSKSIRYCAVSIIIMIQIDINLCESRQKTERNTFRRV